MKIWGEIPKVSGIYDKNKKLNKVDGISGISSKKDVISISNQAKDIQTVMKVLKDVPDVRQEKVKELSEKYESGGYNANGKEIADKIISSIMDKRI